MILKDLYLYDTLSRSKKKFISIEKNLVGIYLCGPTVYGEAHLGHARSAISVDILIRILKFLNFKVKYVRNITDVGHLERDSDDGEDKILKKSKLENLDPMEIVNFYTNRYREDILKLNIIAPNIEPTASGHINEQIDFISKLIEKKFAYQVNGSVYFDIKFYNKKFNYGILSKKILEDLFCETRKLSNQSEKKFFADFSLWKKVSDNHIMFWNSPWGKGYPGWHIECSVMSLKYLGKNFDIHAAGLDICFPHNECEIAQNKAFNENSQINYWFHNNMLLIGDKKMSKSFGNFITLKELFSGSHEILDQAYDPMTLRFFFLQSHYRNVISFSLESIKSAKNNLCKLLNVKKVLKNLLKISKEDFSLEENFFWNEFYEESKKIFEKSIQAILDDLDTPKVIFYLFEISKKINYINLNKEEIPKKLIEFLLYEFSNILENILGIKDTQDIDDNDFINFTLDQYLEGKKNKDYHKMDMIKKIFLENNLSISDTKKGVILLHV
jgi:cysteinyl-tRNA synthetase